MEKFIKKTKLKLTWPLHLMLIPAIISVVIFSYLPMVGIVIAFQDYFPSKGFFGSPWIGLEHFKYLTTLPDVAIVVRNTLIISILKICLTLFVALTVALLLNEVRGLFFKRITQTTLLFPYFISWVILGGIFIDIFSTKGAINNLIVTLFNLEKGIYFMGDPEWFRIIIIATHVWKEMGYSMVIFLAAITTIDPSLYESALIDGANRWKQTLYITIPSIAPMIILLLTLSLGGILNAGFDQIFVMYNSLVYETADIIDTYVYRLGLMSAQYSLATAVGLFKAVVGFILIVISYWLAGKFANYKIF